MIHFWDSSYHAQIWQNFGPVLHQPSKMVHDMILKIVILYSQDIAWIYHQISLFIYFIEIIIVIKGEPTEKDWKTAKSMALLFKFNNV